VTIKVIDAGQLDSAKVVGAELADTTGDLAIRLSAPLTIDTVADLHQAVDDRRTVDDAIERVEAFFDQPVKMAYELHRTLTSRRRDILAPLLTVKKQIGDAISRFKIRADLERLEQERQQADERRRADEARAASEAAQLEHDGQHQLAAAVMAEAIAAPTPVVALPDVTKQVAGLRFRRSWHWRYMGGPSEVAKTPPQILARSLSLVPREFLTLDESKVQRYASAMKQSASVPGLEFFYTDDPVR
jgi:hypothetical protein